ncbi:MAG: hypothetical protein RR762_13565 [Glutamicibacter sp.]|uniref:hypothetical protein n=1 Tax=unclassified Glutamicibacter TaxID=2627139 RepID=UPI002FC6D5CC
MNANDPVPDHAQEEAELSAELEEIWQEESITTAATTEIADEVEGELGTRNQQ